MLDLDSLEAKAKAVDQGVLLFDGAKLYADTTLSLIRELREARAAVAAEREACAAVAADMGLAFERSESGLYANEAAYRVEHAIRARCEKGGGAKC